MCFYGFWSIDLNLPKALPGKAASVMSVMEGAVASAKDWLLVFTCTREGVCATFFGCEGVIISCACARLLVGGHRARLC